MNPVRVAIAPILVLGSMLQAAHAAPLPRPVVILTSSSVEAFGEAVEGMRRTLGTEVRVVTLDLASKPEAISRRLAENNPALLVAVGNNALQTAEQFGAAPVIATMLVRADLVAVRQRSPAGAVVLDLAFGDVLAGLARAFPGKSHAGMILNSGMGAGRDATLIAQARGAGIELQVIDCPLPEKLIQSLRSLRQQVDFVWCPPDGALFNGTTIKPLILASLEYQLPLVGFSEGFVRAGGAAGIYPDYFEVGVQAGEMARKFLAGANISNEGPRKTRVAINPRIGRLLGLKLSHSESGLVVIE